MKKDRMFQYAYEGFGTQIPEDTDLITKEEAYALWDKYYEEVKQRLIDDERPQMVIWKDCESNTDYHTEEKEIHWHDCEVQNGSIYRIKKEEII